MARPAGVTPADAADEDPLPLVAAPDLARQISLWHDWLAHEKRASSHTLAAYGSDLAGLDRYFYAFAVAARAKR